MQCSKKAKFGRISISIVSANIRVFVHGFRSNYQMTKIAAAKSSLRFMIDDSADAEMVVRSTESDVLEKQSLTC